MKQIQLGKSNLKVPAIVVGCMRLTELEESKVACFVEENMELGLNHFDHADIYGGGACEDLFGTVLKEKPSLREKMIIQSKCGIVPGIMYDNSKEHILNSVDASLKRLHTEYLDVLLLHRPDALVEPEEVADAFDQLKASGKVRNFGVSNQNPMQIQLLQKYVKQPIVANQLQLSVTNSNMIRQGLEVNMETEGAIDRDGSVLDFCRFHEITIQTWSPFQYGFFEGVFIGSEKYKELNEVLDRIAASHEVSKTAIVTAWILRHPANMQMIAGTTKVTRMKEICQGATVNLSRQEWYEIYLKAGHMLP